MIRLGEFKEKGKAELHGLTGRLDGEMTELGRALLLLRYRLRSCTTAFFDASGCLFVVP